MERDDAQLVTEYLEGDDASLSFLVDRYVNDVYNFTLRLTGDKHAAEDITQEAFIKAWKNIRSFRIGGSFKAWLFTIARNTAIDVLRQKRDVAFSAFENAQGENVLAAALADGAPLPEDLLVQAEDVAYVQSLLMELDPLYRDVLTLRYEHDLTFEQIGAALKRPLHTVKSQHRRALAALLRLAEARPA